WKALLWDRRKLYLTGRSLSTAVRQWSCAAAWSGFPAARDPADGTAWLAHCYGTVGAGRDNDADSGSGTELYVVTGHAPRQLDRNITVVGRVVQGMELLSALPRGPAPAGLPVRTIE